MAAAVKYLSQMTNDIFEAQMQRAARKISESGQRLPRHAG
jgi:hypothetical protein